MSVRLNSPHKDWKLDLLGVPDARAFGVDELLTKLWMRIEYGNRPTTTRIVKYTRVEELAAEIQDPHNSAFIGFEPGTGVAEAWLRADLLRVFKRNKDEFSVARPLHLPATRLRNARKGDDSAASAIVYQWLATHAPDLIGQLLDWLAVDANDRESQSMDLASYALVRLAENLEPDIPRGDPPKRLETCEGQGKAYCEDLRALLSYRYLLPRTVLITHIGRLTALHLGLGLLRLYQAVVDVEQSGSRRCAGCSVGKAPEQPTDDSVCPYKLEIVADCSDDRRSETTALAESTWQDQEEVLARYVRSHLTLRKLQEVASDVGQRGPLPITTLEEIALVESRSNKAKFIQKFEVRLESLIESAEESDRESLNTLRGQYENLGLTPFRTYVAILHYLSETRWFNYHRFVLDSCFLKNANDGAMLQPLGGRRRRRVALSASMVETLTLVALIDPQDQCTQPLRVDELIDRLASRYGLLVARPPSQLIDDADATKAMIDNHHQFRRLLRETGLFVDLSDAFLAQAIRPRIEVRK
jgi:hypothetical protein